MPFITGTHRSAPMIPFPAPLSLHRAVARIPMRQRPRVTPRILPILQAPTFLKKSDFIYEDGEDQRHEKTHDQLTIMDSDHGKKLTHQIALRVPSFTPQQNYPKQPLLRLSARANRRVEPKYPPHFFFIH